MDGLDVLEEKHFRRSDYPEQQSEKKYEVEAVFHKTPSDGNNADICHINAHVDEEVSRQKSCTYETQSKNTHSSEKPKTESVEIKSCCTGAGYSVCSTKPKSLTSPLPSHFTNKDDLFLEEQKRQKRKSNAYDTASTQKEAGFPNIKYTSLTTLASEILKKTKTDQTKKKVDSVGLKTGGKINVNKEEMELQLSQFGIHEKRVLECCLGEWILTNLDLNVYEMEQAKDIKYLREKRNQRRFTICGRCWLI